MNNHRRSRSRDSDPIPGRVKQKFCPEKSTGSIVAGLDNASPEKLQDQVRPNAIEIPAFEPFSR